MHSSQPNSQCSDSFDPEATSLSLLEQTQAYLQALLERRAPDTLLTQAWQEFYRVYSELIRRFVISHGVRGADADDCVQEVWSAVSLKLAEFVHPGNKPGLRSWLYTVVRSKTTDVIRGNIRRSSHDLDALIEKGVEPESDEPDPAQVTEQQWDAAMVNTAMDELRRQAPEVNCRVLEMRVMEGRSEAETAAALGLTPEQVRYRKHRTQRKLQALLAVYTGRHFG
jgi:RNA polymerase sigma-70 factor (ECF subfamily)